MSGNDHTPLLTEVANGDQEAMRTLIKRYSGLVWSLVRRKISSQNDAEDLVQEIFADIWKSAHRYDPSIGSEDTFVAMITRRRIIDQIRRIGRSPTQVTLDAPNARIACSENEDIERFDTTPNAKRVMRVLRSLRPERRQTIELAVVHGLSHSQIAESTGMPLGTVKAHLRRGLDEVRTLLNPQLSADSKGVTP
ncbi:MAG: sigma-70 family RNA polymerase sigma factor [Phycisphaerales bacterium]|nr:sigma-70 family RNA polymerase sigma factor [Phycisphaerales bacterium]